MAGYVNLKRIHSIVASLKLPIGYALSLSPRNNHKILPRLLLIDRSMNVGIDSQVDQHTTITSCRLPIAYRLYERLHKMGFGIIVQRDRNDMSKIDRENNVPVLNIVERIGRANEAKTRTKTVF